MERFAYIVVYSTSHAMRAEQVLQRVEISCKLVPPPRHLSSDCGVCVRIEQGDLEAARRELESVGLEVEDFRAF